MTDFEELEFVIPAFTPETMPLDRLLEYLQQIGEVLGAPDQMHLVRIEPSSTKPVLKMAMPVASQARQNVVAVRAGKGTVNQRTAFGRIRQMVQKDGGMPASLLDRTGVILEFLPAPEDVGAVTGVRQATSFDGELKRVGGTADDYIPIQMQDLAGELVSGFSAPKALAKEMGKLLFEPIRVTGLGSWERSKAGEWKLSKMLIQTYEPLGDETLGEVLQRLRAADVTWPENADELLRSEREPAE